MRILDTAGTVLRDWRPDPDDRANPEIDRGRLRDLLLGSLDVRWGRGVTKVVPGTRDGVLVYFADGGQETFDLVVGADGAWSRIRPAVSSVTPHYTGVTAVETSLDDVDARHPDLARLIGDGSLAVYGVNRSLVAQRNSDGHVKVYAQFRAPLDWHTNLDLADAEAVRSGLLALYAGTPREPGPRRSPRPLRPGPAILTAERSDDVLQAVLASRWLEVSFGGRSRSRGAACTPSPR
ncbi:hypothetical protein LDL08_35520 [Nonomuraea glycinis]|uniref:FAD-binding domain-containing protein n=1 Tax=Nonomuraea glycinis TaxID=2047744 RepID=A0A918ACQ7_9ACTN|nr:hypothetical protein [Nonomuraea glycinis]MCA2181485.1 hypothetical protein [Nonomuraea glycinis]GGP14575.1 hypothetical protein GCM10012278_70930 [Nonomuraea glycinis]